MTPTEEDIEIDLAQDKYGYYLKISIYNDNSSIDGERYTEKQAEELKQQILSALQTQERLKKEYEELMKDEHASCDTDNYGCMTCARLGIIKSILEGKME